MRQPRRSTARENAPGAGLRSPTAIIPALLIALTLVLSACSSTSNTNVGGTTSGQSGHSSVSSTPTSLPTPNAHTATCAQAPGFSGAPPAGVGSAGQNFTDVAFPANSVSVASTAFSDVYAFQLINACTNNTNANVVRSFYASSLPSAGWSQSATYPYKGNVSSICGDPYCWRKQIGGDIRYVSLENVNAAGSVVVYVLRVAQAPTPSFNVVQRYNASNVPEGQTISVTANCNSGEYLLGGGYFITDSNKIYEAGDSYPSSMSAWTAAVYNNTSAPMSLTTYAECAQANFPLGIQMVSKSASLSAGGGGPVWAECPSGTAAVGGGVQSSDPGGNVGFVVTSSPGVDFTKDAWTVNTKAQFGAVTETAWVVCASNNAVTSRRVFGGTTSVGASSSGQQTPGCNTDEYATAGGFIDAESGDAGDLFYYYDAPTTAQNVWIVDAYNRDSGSAHNIATDVFCVYPQPLF